MKKVKIYLMCLGLFMGTSGVFAQSIGVNLGLNLSSMTIEDDDFDYCEDCSMRLGYHLGGNISFAMSDNMNLEIGLLFNTKGTKAEAGSITSKTNLGYLDVPILAKYNFGSDDMGIMAIGGLSLGYGIMGKYKLDFDGNEEESDVVWGSDDDSDFKALDYGVIVGAGLMIDKLQITLTYNLGLANISPYEDDSYNVNNNVIRLGVSYRLTD